MPRKVFLSGALGTLATAAVAQTGRRPKNVLLLMSDPHKPHAMGIDGDPVAITPNLDALCRSSFRFDSAYCWNPVCGPSRASLLTALYTHNHGAYNNTLPRPF